MLRKITLFTYAMTYTFTNPQFWGKQNPKSSRTRLHFNSSIDPVTLECMGMQRVKKYTLLLMITPLGVELKSVFPAFLGILSMRYCAVVPQEAVTFLRQ